MIEVKFRAWDKVNKRMGYFESGFSWCDEYYLWHLTPDDSIQNNKMVCDVPCGDNIILMQYIGIKDKNKKDIYEGDLLKSKDGKINVVIWSNKLNGYILGTWLKKGKEKDLDIKTLEEKIVECTYFIGDEDKIIGNIHENLELMEIK